MQPQTIQTSSDASSQQQVIDRLRSGVNVLVTVSNNPTVDQLAAAIGFTLMLNKLGKHATAVFSGNVPSTLEFLKPEATIEKTTDSLRDFIISLDKSKADKLRYKVEEDVVKIFITPYRTSLSEKDLEFGQGDFNVDVVVALGVLEQRQVDQAITAHGRILHDATVITISAGDKASTLGAINWHDPTAASLCEMLVSVGDALQPNLLDAQDATALLTGIVAETNRFSNDKTSPRIMSMAAQLMAAGANQQLIASELEKDSVVVPEAKPKDTEAESADGSLKIEHEEGEEEPGEGNKDIAIDEHGNLKLGGDESSNKVSTDDTEAESLPPALEDATLRDIEKGVDSPHIVKDPTSTLDEIEEAVDSPHVAQNEAASDSPTPAMVVESKDEPEIQGVQGTGTDYIETPRPKELVLPPLAPAEQPTVTALEPAAPISPEPVVENIPDQVVVPEEAKEEQVEDARDAVMDALNSAPYDESRPAPVAALNANPIDLSPVPETPVADTLQPSLDADPSPATEALDSGSKDMFTPVDKVEPVKLDNASDDINEESAPPVPPPMMPMS